MSHSLWLTIPTGTRDTYLKNLIDSSGIPKDQIVIVNTILDGYVAGVHNLYETELNIQKWWNLGIKFAMDNGASHVAILNDDLELIGDPLQKIFNLMIQEDATIGYPLPATSDPCGYCFILNTEHGIFPDEKYRWWYGDNDLYKRAKKTIGVLATVNHLHPNELTARNPELLSIAEQDKQTWLSSQ